MSLLLVAFVFGSCKQQKKDASAEGESDTEMQAEAPKITLEKLDGSPAYAEAVLQLEEPSNTTISDGGEVNFKFTMTDYELGAQTSGPNAERLANSGKGQHIHFILNNQPYSAHYEPEFAKEIPNGVHHLVAFLSRSYHESVKNDNSVVVKKMTVGPDAEDTFQLEAQALGLGPGAGQVRV
ncbi:MAG: hypothetical protein AAF361_15100, partial [Bacteroidota bacterium]